VGRVQRRALGVLFLAIAASLAFIAIAAFVGSGGGAGRLIVGFAALALAVWLASMSLSAFRS
jgi:hypothetical protein